MARTYEVYLRVEKSGKKINFICSNQRVIFFYYIDIHECFENKSKLDEKHRKNKGMTSAISLIVRIWKYLTRIPDTVSYGKYELSTSQ